MFTCKECGVAVIIIRNECGETVKAIRPCPHKQAGILASVSAKAVGVGGVKG